MAAVHFAPASLPSSAPYAGIRLPPSGPVGATASIGLNGQSVSVGLMESRNGQMLTAENQFETAQIETLQKEVVALRRRLSMLSEQNATYSRRLADLENQFDTANTTAPAETTASIDQAALRARVASERPAPKPSVPRADVGKGTQVSAMDAQKAPAPAAQRSHAGSRIEVLPAPETMNRKITLTRPPQVRPVSSEQFEPVRVVSVSEADPEASLTTGSIPNQSALTPSAEESEPEPIMVRPSTPAGRATGPGKTQIGRTDFGAVVGRFESTALAQAAWIAFKEENSERMQDLSALTAPSELSDGQVDLLVGPFANAADAAVACLQLLQITETCHPALFVGDTVPLLPVAEAANVPASRIGQPF
ncbi:hypothetical protein [Roseibium sp.]|uniref:hypothetical protein n=1 Tax=Roseibium sp. TaxID=1936156 RepID=UPI003A978846